MPKRKWAKFSAAFLSLMIMNDALATATSELFNLSLRELLEIKVSTGKLSTVNPQASPSAVTIIQKNHIELSSAKNLAELLEIHVPGLMLMAHSEGDKIGLRGHIAAENYKLLLLVNGRNITNMVYEGCITEIDQWDLSDIEKVEVVRGPGSVVYGTGAIAGVINIITKSASVTKNGELNVSYNPTYSSRGVSYQWSKVFNNFDAYLFSSVRSSDGLSNPDYYAPGPNDETDIRYVGKQDSDEYGPQPYLGDSFDRPQIKLHLDLNFQNNFKLFARYTQSGQLHHFRSKVPALDGEGNVIGLDDSRKVSLRSFMLAPEYDVELSSRSNLNAKITYDTQEYLRYDQANLLSPEKHPNNIKDYAFSQNRWLASLLYSHKANYWDITTGFELKAINIGAPWGKSKDHIMVREGVYLISDFETSVYTQDVSLRNRPGEENSIEIGNGLDFYTYSFLFEGDFNLRESLTLHYAHRLDFPDVSSTMFSPRLSLISNPKEGHSWAATVQRAQRMMPLRAQYLHDLLDGRGDNEHENLDGIELSYSHDISERTFINSRIFYNDIDAVGYTGRDLQFLANLKLAGVELEAWYKTPHVEVIASHSYLRNVDFKMNESLKTGGNKNNISFSDYYHFTRGDVPLLLEGYGSGINNWSENSSKIVITKRFKDDAITAQLNAQIFWDYRGSYDEMRMYQQAYANIDIDQLEDDDPLLFEQQRIEFERERSLLKKQGAFEAQYNVGASLAYTKKINDDRSVKLIFYAQNLIDSRYRYYVSTGSRNHYPNRLVFMKEPAVLGLKFEFIH